MKDHSQENSVMFGAQFEEAMTECGEPTFDELRQIEIDVIQVNHKFPLTTRIEAVLIGFREDNFDVDMAVDVLTECKQVIQRADENLRSISGMCAEIDKGLERLSGKVRVQI